MTPSPPTNDVPKPAAMARHYAVYAKLYVDLKDRFAEMAGLELA
jgi:hypothetical protein